MKNTIKPPVHYLLATANTYNTLCGELLALAVPAAALWEIILLRSLPFFESVSRVWRLMWLPVDLPSLCACPLLISHPSRELAWRTQEGQDTKAPINFWRTPSLLSRKQNLQLLWLQPSQFKKQFTCFHTIGALALCSKVWKSSLSSWSSPSELRSLETGQRLVSSWKFERKRENKPKSCFDLLHNNC